MKILSADRPQRAATTPGLTLSGRALAISLAAVALLLTAGVLSFGPVFDGPDGYVAAGGGVLLGLVIGFFARRQRWAAASTAAVAVGAYLVFGGVFALRKTTVAGFVPTLETLTRLVPLSVQAWRDLLTLSPPANNFVGPAVVPYLSGLVLGLVTAWLALGTRRYLWALLPAVSLLVVGILWGLDDAPLAAYLGGGFGAVALLWATWRRTEARRRDGEEILVEPAAGGTDPRRWAAAAGVVVVALAASLVAAPMLGTGIDRHVLRRTVQPPLNLEDYASPLTSYRYLEVDQKNETLFTVTGLPAGARIQLATLDAYDGHVYKVADTSASFLRIGERTSARGSGTAATLQISIAKYAGIWLPGGGDVRGVRFSGSRAQQQADTLYYNSYGGSLVSTAGAGEGDAYTVDLVLPTVPTDPSASLRVAAASTPALERVPDVIGKVATEYAGDAATPLEQLRNIEKKLREDGYYANGANAKSRSGHTAERVASMLTATQLVGDDEQYAVAMALMARQLGIPARVVMGFYPDEDRQTTGPLEVTGSMAHAWVEVPFEGAGWLHFDPTPDRDKTPQTIVPKPQPQPKPQVLPPPDPPVNKVDDPLDASGKKNDDSDKTGNELLLRILTGIGIGLGVAALVSSPFVAIGALKKRRRNRRMNADDLSARVSGAWDEIVDAATDLGTRLKPVATRRETGLALAGVYPGADAPRLAAWVDAGVFGPAVPSAAGAEAVWADADRAMASMRGQVGRWRRVRAFCSLRSFGRPRLPSFTRDGLTKGLFKKGSR